MSDSVDTPERVWLPTPRDPGAGLDQNNAPGRILGGMPAGHVEANLETWRTHPWMPAQLRSLLTLEYAAESVRSIAREAVPPWFTALLAGYGEAAAALSLSPRRPVLWKWCRFHIRATAYTWKAPTPALVALTERLADVKLGLVLFNALVDDVADVLRDPDLLTVFLAIPTAGGGFGAAADSGAYAALRGELARIGRTDAEAYFDLTVSTWHTTLGELRDAAGPAYPEFQHQLATDYRHILASMRFSFDLNREPGRVLRMSPAALERAYGAPDVETILAHNANRAAFFTIDLMAASRCDPDRFRKLVAGGGVDLARRGALIFQEMHIIGNALATGAREAAVDDVTNEVFTSASRLLNVMDPSSIPARLRGRPDPDRDGVLIAALNQARATRSQAPTGHGGAGGSSGDGRDPAADIAELIALSGAEQHCLRRWLDLRGDAVEALRATEDSYDARSLLAANDRQLVLHLAYQGGI